MKRLESFNLRPLTAVALLTFAMAGCGRDEVKVYKVNPSDTSVAPPTASGSTAMPLTMPAGMAVPDHSGQPKLKYTLPAGWQEKPAAQMRVASFNISENGKQADVSVIPLGGMAGGDAANVNRWRGQVGLETLPEAELHKLAEKVEAAGQPAELYDMAGTSSGSGDASRILATILHQDDTVWFFKMTGESALVEKHKAAFIAFLKSVEFGEIVPMAQTDMGQLPPSHPAIPGMTMPTMPGTQMPATDTGSKPTWTIPNGWQEGPLAQFLIAKYVISGTGDLKAEVNVSSLAGDGGGLLSNLNRWRTQLGQPPITEMDLAKLPVIDASGAKATLVEFSGTNPRTSQPAQLVGVVLPLGGQTWFYKLMGDAEVVAQQKNALIQFVQSAKYPGR